MKEVSNHINSEIKKALYLPAVIAVRCNPDVCALYNHLREREHKRRKQNEKMLCDAAIRQRHF